jgi:sugar lactone lactonase YvrE
MLSKGVAALMLGAVASIGSTAVMVSGSASASSASPPATSPVVGGTLYTANVGSNSIYGLTSLPTPAGAVAPSIRVKTQVSVDKAGNLDEPYGITTDAQGNTWVANYGSSVNTIAEFTPTDIANNMGPSVVLSSTTVGGLESIDGPVGLAFDTSGNLWVTNYTGDTIAEFSPSELTSSGSPTPTVIVSSSDLSGPESLALHSYTPPGQTTSSNYLWTVNARNDSLCGFALSGLTPQTGVVESANAQVLVEGASTGLFYPAGLAFDQSGNVWVSNDNGSTLVTFTPAQLSNAYVGSRSPQEDPAPNLTINAHSGPFASCVSLYERFQITFDSAGNLYVANRYCGTNSLGSLTEFGANQLTQALSSASTTPTATLVPANQYTNGSLDEPQGVAFLPGSGAGQVVVSSLGYPPASPSSLTILNLSLDNNAVLDQLYALATDASGDLWVANYDSNTIDEYTPADIASGGGPNIQLFSDTLTVGSGSNTYSSLYGPDGLAFDAQGNLWVSNYDGSSIVEFSKAQVSASHCIGNPTPLAFFTTSPSSPGSVSANTVLEYPESIAIHSINGSDYLWVDNETAPSSVNGFPLSDMTGSGLQQIPTPALSISGTATNLGYPAGLAFDAQGNLWLSNYSSLGTINEFSNAQLVSGLSTGTLNQTPRLTITASTVNGNATSLEYPYQIAFDAAGNLFVANFNQLGATNSLDVSGNGSIVEYSASELVTASQAAASNPSTSQSQPLVPTAIGY